EAFPYRGYTVITMEDATTGRVKITVYTVRDSVVVEDDYKEYDGYVDMATGIILRADTADYADIILMTPFAGLTSASVKSSTWGNYTTALTYTCGEDVYNLFVYNRQVYFGVTFTDRSGNAVAAENCYNAPYVYVKDAAGTTIASFGYNGTTMVALDGLEGTYTDGTDTIFATGFGTLTLNETVQGVYFKAPADADYDVDVYLLSGETKVAYYQVTLGDGTFTKVQPMVTLTFAGDNVTNEPVSVNKNIAYTLPVPTSDTQVLMGWRLPDGTEITDGSFIPTESVTLTAIWANKCTVTIVGAQDGDPTTLDLGAGNTIVASLPNYAGVIDEENGVKFFGWFVDVNGNGTYDEDTDLALSEDATIYDETALTVIAVWEDLPAYYGTYHGGEMYGNGSSYNKGGKTLTIDAEGNISSDINGFKTGFVVSYDPATQKITWKTSETDTTVRYFYLDPETGILAFGYSDATNIGYDYYLMGKYAAENGIHPAQIGVRVENPLSASSYGYYAQFVTIATKDGGTREILLYGNHIYNNLIITNSVGETLTAAGIKTSKTLVVKNGETDSLMFAMAAAKDNFGSNGWSDNNTALDAYYGVYTCGEGTVALDGTGIFTWGDKSGTYELIADTATFKVYIVSEGVNTEYYTMTLSDRVATLTKPTATISFVTGYEDVTCEDKAANLNIALTLPTPEKAGYVFRGWYVVGAESTLYTTYTATSTDPVTLTAKWDVQYLLNVYFNTENATEATTDIVGEIHGEGDTITMAIPVYEGHRFLGWYTTEDFQTGTEWTNGTTITANLTIYAKWGVAVLGYGTYTGKEIHGETTTGGTRTVTIDEEGNVTGSYTGSIASLNNTAGFVTLKYGTSDVTCYFDPVNGILITPYGSSYTVASDSYFMVNQTAPATDVACYGLKSPDTSSYTYRLVSYTRNDTACIVLITLENVYLNVTLEDAFGNALEDLTAVKNSKTVVVKASDSTVVLSLAAKNSSFSGGSSTVALDGKQGTYTVSGTEGTLSLDGAGNVTWNGNSGTYKLNSEGTAYDVYMTESGSQVYYVMTLDGSAATVTKPTATITYVTGFEDVVLENSTAGLNVAFTLPIPEKAGYKFRGWYVTDASTLISTYTATTTDTVTLTAKWDVAYTFTVKYNDGTTADLVEVYGEGDTLTVAKPAWTGHRFLGWYTTEDFQEGTEWTSGATITATTTIYAKWGDPVPGYGTYTGYETESESYTRTSMKTVTIDEEGNVTGSYTGSVATFGSTPGFVTLGGKNCFFDPVNGILMAPYGSAIASDGFLMVRGSTSISSVSCYGFKAPGTSTYAYRLISYTVDGVAHLAYVTNDCVYADVTFTAKTADGTAVTAFSDIKTAKSVIVLSSESVTLLEIVAVNDSFSGGSATQTLDGTQGTYTGTLGTIVSEGTGTLTVGDTTVSYVLDSGKISFNYLNRYRVITVAEGAYTVVADGLAGTYTLPDGTTTYTLDGYGTVTGVGTYTFVGTTLTVYVTDGESTDYGIDSEGMNLLGKSQFAGLTYTGGGFTVIFDDVAGAAITGVFKTTSYPVYEYGFTATYEGGVLTFTITSQNYNMGFIGKTFAATVGEDTITFTSDSDFKPNNTDGVAGVTLTRQ
ncbi:MAG: InlB B-repeat-containing protein, partial [Eubacteriales bacterium]